MAGNNWQVELRLREAIQSAQEAGDVAKELQARELLQELQNPVDRQKQLAESKGFGEAALIGAGRSMSQLGQGIAQLAGYGRPVEEKAAEDAAYGALQEAAPVATAVGETVPYLVAGGAGGIGQGVGRAMLGQAGRAATVGGLMEGTAEERMKRAALEGGAAAVGTGLGRAVGGVLAPGAQRAAPEVLDVVNEAQRAGYRVLPSSRFESPRFRQTIEGGLEATPGGAVALDRVAAQNAERLSQHAAQAIGEQGRLTGETLLRAESRIGQAFNDVAANVGQVPVDNQLIDDVVRVYSERVSPMIAGPEDPVAGMVERAIDYLAKAERSGGMTGRELLAQQSKIGKAATGAFSSGNSELGLALVDMQDALLSALERSASQADTAALQQARQQWRMLKTLQAGQNVDPVTGTVHPGRLANFLQRKDRAGWYGENDSDLYKGARFLGRVQPRLPSSGTAERLYLQQALRTGLGGLALGGAGGYAAGDPLHGGAVGATLGTLGGLVAPHALARAYMSRPGQAWMGAELPGLARWGLGAAGRGLMGGSVVDDLTELEQNRKR